MMKRLNMLTIGTQEEYESHEQDVSNQNPDVYWPSHIRQPNWCSESCEKSRKPLAE